MGYDYDIYGRPHNIDVDARNLAYGFNYDDPHMVAQAMRDELSILSPRGQMELIQDTQRFSEGALRIDPILQRDIFDNVYDTGQRQVSVNTEYGQEPIAILQGGPQRPIEPGVYEPGVTIDLMFGMNNCSPFRFDRDEDRMWRERGERIWEEREEHRRRDPDFRPRLSWVQPGFTPQTFHGGEHHGVGNYTDQRQTIPQTLPQYGNGGVTNPRVINPRTDLPSGTVPVYPGNGWRQPHTDNTRTIRTPEAVRKLPPQYEGQGAGIIQHPIPHPDQGVKLQPQGARPGDHDHDRDDPRKVKR